ncbi:MAG: ACT domain-containing protein [Clostridiales bacterium]|nr:ACT domain-containing protein [Clostridiales bacterium]
MELKMKGLIIEPISVGLSVCKVTNYNNIDLSQPFVFTGSTDQEMSLVCPTELVPGNTTNREDGWRAFRIQGMLDFSLVGILARIAKVLASNQIGIFAISTFNTDYILVKDEIFDKALTVLKNAGYPIRQPEKE